MYLQEHEKRYRREDNEQNVRVLWKDRQPQVIAEQRIHCDQGHARCEHGAIDDGPHTVLPRLRVDFILPALERLLLLNRPILIADSGPPVRERFAGGAARHRSGI